MTTRWVASQTDQVSALDVIADVANGVANLADTPYTAGSATLTMAQFLNALMRASGQTAAVSLTTPSAAAIVAALPNCQVGSRADFIVINSNTVNGAITMVAGSGVTLLGNTGVPAGRSQTFKIVVTNATVGAEAVELVGLMFVDNSPQVIANFRNLIDGGDFTINPWQRGTSFAAISNAVTYTADRFFADASAAASIAVSKQANTDVAGFSQALQWGRTNADTHTAIQYLGQVMETIDSIRMQGQQVTLSFYAKCGANFLASSANFTVQLISGTGTDQSAASMVAATWTGQSNVINGTVVPTTATTRYSFTGTVPAGCTQLGLLISYTPSGTAGANEWIQFMGIQLEAGGVPTVFEHRDAQVELEICQRYAYQINEPGAGVVVGSGIVSASNTEIFYLALPVQMRASPSVTVTVGSFKSHSATGGTVAATGLTGNATHTVNAIGLTSTGTGTSGQGALLEGGGGAGSIVVTADY